MYSRVPFKCFGGWRFRSGGKLSSTGCRDCFGIRWGCVKGRSKQHPVRGGASLRLRSCCIVDPSEARRNAGSRCHCRLCYCGDLKTSTGSTPKTPVKSNRTLFISLKGRAVGSVQQKRLIFYPPLCSCGRKNTDLRFSVLGVAVGNNEEMAG